MKHSKIYEYDNLCCMYVVSKKKKTFSECFILLNHVQTLFNLNILFWHTLNNLLNQVHVQHS